MKADFDDLFRNHLGIRFLRQGVFMSLDGRPDLPGHPRQDPISQGQYGMPDLGTENRALHNPDRDRNNCTTLWKDANVDWHTFNEQIDKDTSVLPEPTTGKQYFEIYCKTGLGVEMYLQLNDQLNALILAEKANPNSYCGWKVFEWWEVRDGKPDEFEFQSPNLNLNISKRVFVRGKTKHVDATYYTLGMNDRGQEFSFYWNPLINGNYLVRPIQADNTNQIGFAFRSVAPPAVQRIQIIGFMMKSALPPSSLRDFIKDTQGKEVESITAQQSLVAMITEQSITDLHLTRNYEKSLLTCQVDQDFSKVNYQMNQVSFDITSAKLVLKPPEPPILKVNDDPLNITSIELSLECKGDLFTNVQLDVITGEVENESATLSLRRVIKQSKATSNLAKVLASLGYPKEDYEKVRIPKLLAFLMASNSMAGQLLQKAVPIAVLEAGLCLLKPDLEKSTAVVKILPTTDLLIERADIICTFDPESMENCHETCRSSICGRRSEDYHHQPWKAVTTVIIHRIGSVFRRSTESETTTRSSHWI